MNKRKEVYNKIRELKLEEVVQKKFGRNFTQVSTAELEQVITLYIPTQNKIIKKSSTKAVSAKEEKKVSSNKGEKVIPKTAIKSEVLPKGSTEAKFLKLIEILAKRRILLNSDLEQLKNV